MFIIANTSRRRQLIRLACRLRCNGHTLALNTASGSGAEKARNGSSMGMTMFKSPLISITSSRCSR